MKHVKRIIPLAISCLLLAACQATPEADAVTQKNGGPIALTLTVTDTSEQGTASSLRDTLEIPEQISEEFTDGASHLTITVDASVECPDGTMVPVATVKRDVFHADDAENFYKTLFAGSVPIGKGAFCPKWYYESMLDSLLAMRESGQLDKYDSMEELDAEIEALVRQTAEAPEQAERVEPDFSADAMLYQVVACDETAKTVSTMIIFEDQMEYYRDVNTVSLFSRQTAQSYQNTDGYPSHQDCVENGRSVALPAISAGAARAQAEGLLEELGYEDFAFAGYRTALLEQNTDGSYQGVHEILFTRVVDGVQVTFTDHGSSNDPAVTDDTMAASWPYERIRIYVDDDGIYAMLFNGPCGGISVTAEGNSLLPFAQVMEIFKKQVAYQLGDYEQGGERRITITDIRLGLARVATPGATDAGTLVPAWDFFGTYADGYGKVYGYDGYLSLLTVNAMDGSVISRIQGY